MDFLFFYLFVFGIHTYTKTPDTRREWLCKTSFYTTKTKTSSTVCIKTVYVTMEDGARRGTVSKILLMKSCDKNDFGATFRFFVNISFWILYYHWPVKIEI